MNSLERLLIEALDMCRSGKCDYITPDELDILSSIMHRPETVGREEAAKYLGISLNKFHKLKDNGVILEPRKKKGFKEKEYYLSDLSKSLEIIKERGL